MNNPVFVWINDIKLSASLPTANCEFISSKRTFNAITSTAIARNCYISNGPALMALSNDYQDNIYSRYQLDARKVNIINW